MDAQREETICHLLWNVLSDKEDVRKPAEEGLMCLQREPLLCSTIQRILEQPGKDITLKHSATTVYLSTVRSFWVSAEGGYTIRDDEKEFLRKGLLVLLHNEEPKIISDQISNILAHVVMFDFPSKWPDVFHVLASLVSSNSSSPGVLLRILEALYQSLRRVCDALDIDKGVHPNYMDIKTALSNSASAIFNVIIPVWMNTARHTLSVLSKFLNDNEPFSPMSEILGKQCYLSLRVMKLLFRHFFNLPEQECVSFFQEMMQLFSASLQCKRALELRFPAENILSLDSCLLTYLKIVNVSQEHQATSFAPVLDPFLRSYYGELASEALRNAAAASKYPSLTFWENYIIHLLYFYNTLFIRRDFNKPTEAIAGFFTLECKIEFSRLLFWYLRVTPAILKAWKHDPEQFVDDELAATQRTSVAASAEDVLFRLMRSDDNIGIHIYSLARQILKDNSSATLESVVSKEACYRVLAISSSALQRCPDVNFREFFFSCCVPDFESGEALLQRRILSVINGWATEIYGQDEELEDKSFAMCVHCLRSSDLALQVYAALAVQSLLDNSDMEESECSAKYLQPIVESILNLVKRLQEQDIITNMLKTVSLLIDSLGRDVEPFAGPIIELMANMWGSCQNKPFILSGIVCILTTMVSELDSVQELEGQFLSIIQVTFTSTMKDMETVKDEALRLWGTLVQRSKQLSPGLASLFPCLGQVLASHRGDHHIFKGCLVILEAYILVGGPEFVNAMTGPIIIECFMGGLRSDRAPILCSTLEVLHTFLVCFPADGPAALKDCLQYVLKITTSGSGESKTKAVFVRAVTVLCRLIMENNAFFVSIVPNEEVLETFIQLLVNKANLEHMKYTDMLSLVSTALTSLLTALPAHLKERYVPSMVLACIEVEGIIRNMQDAKTYPCKLNKHTNAARQKRQVMRRDYTSDKTRLEILRRTLTVLSVDENFRKLVPPQANDLFTQ